MADLHSLQGARGETRLTVNHPDGSRDTIHYAADAATLPGVRDLPQRRSDREQSLSRSVRPCPLCAYASASGVRARLGIVLPKDRIPQAPPMLSTGLHLSHQSCLGIGRNRTALHALLTAPL